MSSDSDSLFILPLQKAIIPNPLTVKPQTRLIDAIALLNQSQTTCSLTFDSLGLNSANTCLIVIENNRPVGILTHRDIVRLIAQKIKIENFSVGEVMSQPVITLEQSKLTHLNATLNLLQHHQIRHLPLVDSEGKLVGLLTHRDLRHSLEPTDLLKLRIIEEVMTKNVVQAPTTISLLELAELMSAAQVSCIVLVEEKICNEESLNIPVGLLTEGDILRFQALGLNWNLEAQVVMSCPVFCLHPHDSLLGAHVLMQQRYINRIPIVGDRGELIGIITPSSILKAINPLDLLQMVDVLKQKVNQLEADKLKLLQSQNTKLEEKIHKRTEALRIANQKLQSEIKNRSLIEAKIAFQASLLDQVRNAIIATDFQGKIIYWNQYAELLYQWKREEALGNNIINFFIPVDYKNLAEEIVKEVQHQGYWEGEFTIYRKDGSLLPIHVFDTLIRDQAGNPIGLIGISFDISERKEAEQKLQQQVQRERLFYQTALHIRQSLKLTNILNNAVVDIRAILNCDRVLVYQFDAKWNGTIVAESIAEGLTPSLGIYLEDTCFKTGKISPYFQGKKSLINNIETAEITECHKQILERFDVKANLVVPILIPNKNRENGTVLWGLLIAHQCFSPRNWYPTELELLDEIAVQLSLGIQQSQLYQAVQTELEERHKVEQELRILNQELETRIRDRTAKLERQERKSRLFAEIALKIRQSLDIEQILQTTVTEVQKILGCDRLLIYRVFSNGTGRAIAESVLPGWRSVLSVDFPEEVFPPEYQQLYDHGTVKAIADIHQTYQEVTPCLVNFLREWCVKAKLIVPILKNHYLWGFMIAHQCTYPRQWTEFELELMREIADQVGVALEQAQLVKTIREREQFIESIADSSPNILYIYDLEEKRSIYNSRSLTPILGYTPLDLSEMGDPFLRIFHPDDQKAVYKHLQKTAKLNDREVSYIEYRIQHQNGEWLWFSSHATIFKRDQNGKVQQILGVAQNITDRKQTELDLYKSNQILEAISHAQAQFITNGDSYLLLENLLSSILTLTQSQYGFMAEVFSGSNGESYLEEYYLKKQGNPHLEIHPMTPNMCSPEFNCVEEGTKQAEYFNIKAFFCTVILAGKPVIINHSILSNTRHPECLPDKNHLTLNSFLGLPFYTHKELLGVVAIANRPGGYDQELIDYLQPFLATCSNIIEADRTERLHKQAENNLKRQLAAVEASIDGISILKNEKYIYVNNAHLELFGYRHPDELLGKSWRLLYTPDVVEWFENQILPILTQQKFWRGETIALRKDGTTFNQEVSLTLTEDGDYICVCQDISERQAALRQRKNAEIQLRQTNEQLAIANAQLARASRLKDEFLANMSHELRTPLNSILGMSEVLQEGTFGVLNDKQNQALEMIYRNGKHLLELINDILDLSKIEAGKLGLDCSPVSVNELCQHSLSFVKQQAHQKNIRLSYQIEDVTEALNVDERRIRQVLINLLNNAVKFTPEGGRVRLEVRGDLNEQTVSFSVIDNGIGIGQDDQDQLFEAFVQIDSRLSRRYEGTGLGLVLVKKLVEMHGGTVKIDSQLGQGSCFTVTLPWTRVSWRETPRLTASEPLDRLPFSGISSHGLKRPLILLAEDNSDNIHTLLNYLQAKGFDVEIAFNGIEAIQKARSLQPQVILMDISMPEMDGLEAMRQIRLDPQLTTLPIIALTALAMQGDREQCLAAGANEYLPKPVQLRQLVQLIQSLIHDYYRN
ncbi:PAS domain S-box protein [Planktothrix sp. FACHB-1365]|uniref:PAS domain S-box protein n=1 Tax=Planktothrix sp. FACHB-1365 TaxID=2692855 RepID=UPI001685676B|nr:PAS domain S-box protein [Planktothrix sp. FACHB-1365]MBD2484347.1 PAS domain S-box protein [Planktothrix sp. FACHB-1365]